VKTADLNLHISTGHYMARKLSTLDCQQAAVQQAREEAFEAASSLSDKAFNIVPRLAV
jgi:hypothetical protein